MDLSGKFVAFFGQKNRIPVRKSNLIIIGSGIITHEPCDNSYYITGTILNKITQVQYCCIQEIIRRSRCEQESDLTAVGHETSQKFRTTTIDTRGAAVSSGR